MQRVGWLAVLRAVALLAVPLIAHSLAHLSGLVATFTGRNMRFAEQPWVFAHGATLHSVVGRVFGLLWLAASLALVGSGLGLLLGQDWWPALALVAAALSLAVILIWWNAVPPGAKAGAAFAETGGIPMRVNRCINCEGFPCADVRHESYAVPSINVRPEAISMVMVSEASPQDPADGYYAPGNPLFQQTTVQAFNDAGVPASSIRDILGMGIYLTTAVKCGKTNYGLQASTIEQCSRLLERELGLFPKTNVLLLMGDVAIQSVNAIARRAGEKRVIPAGSTYKIRGHPYFYRGMRVFPSYLQAGPSFFIEKSKRRMMADDIETAPKSRSKGVSRVTAGGQGP